MAPDQVERVDLPDCLALRAAIVIDPRIAGIWQVIWGLRDPYPGETLDPLAGDADDQDRERTLGVLLRIAYLQGYADAASEPDPDGLFRELGVRPPVVSRIGARARRLRNGPSRRDSSGR